MNHVACDAGSRFFFVNFVANDAGSRREVVIRPWLE